MQQRPQTDSTVSKLTHALLRALESDESAAIPPAV